jgi:hypothetical protein
LLIRKSGDALLDLAPRHHKHFLLATAKRPQLVQLPRRRLAPLLGEPVEGGLGVVGSVSALLYRIEKLN